MRLTGHVTMAFIRILSAKYHTKHFKVNTPILNDLLIKIP